MAKRKEQITVRPASESEANKIAAGGKRLPGGVLSAEAVDDMEHLLSIEYAPSQLKVIERALRQARSSGARNKKPPDPHLERDVLKTLRDLVQRIEDRNKR